jgi:hypothetical protein
MTETLTAISLHQPWAELIALGIKTHETRHWPCPARMIGQRLVIHAAKRPLRRPEIAEELVAHIAGRELAFGAYLLTARVVGCFPTEERQPSSRLDLLAGGWGPGRYAWALEDVQRLANPIPAQGRQSLWNVSSAILEGAQP